MTHAEFLDPELAARLCTAKELEVVLLRNQQPPVTWRQIAYLLGRDQRTVRDRWANANMKVRGDGRRPRRKPAEKLDPGYVEPRDAATERAIRATDTDIQLMWQGVPFVGTRGAITGTQPDKPNR